VKVVFYTAPGKYPEERLQRSVIAGIQAIGDAVELVPNSVLEPVPADVACMVGMKSLDLRRRCLEAGQRVITFDKGYDRKEDWWRVSIDTHQPSRYLLDLARPADRSRENGWHKFRSWRSAQHRGRVLIAGGGLKYHSTHGLPHPNDWATEVVRQLKTRTSRLIVHRSKPSMPDKADIPGALTSREKYMTQALADVWCIVTFGSNASFEAASLGVPSIVLGDGIGLPISSTNLEDIENPKLVSDEMRAAWFANLAYCQFREVEWSDGTAWPEMRRQLEEVPACIGL
jgi:hypothetical protein